RRRHTRLQGDWSSDVCSSDLYPGRMLERVLPRFGIKELPEQALQSLNLAWHRLDAWPDVPAGMSRLANTFLLAPVSNGNISLMRSEERRVGKECISLSSTVRY